MIWGLFLLAGGGLACVQGVRIALGRPRPLAYVGMLLAPCGVWAVFAGLGRLLDARFFGG